jgi:hypothetical protein
MQRRKGAKKTEEDIVSEKVRYKTLDRADVLSSFFQRL